MRSRTGDENLKPMSYIQKLDENFVLPELEGDWEWRDAAGWPLHGRGWSAGIATWGRLPDAAQAIVRPDVWTLSRHSAGLHYEFSTDSPDVGVQWGVLQENIAMDHMAATGVSGLDIYRWDGSSWRMAGIARPTQQQNRTFFCRRGPSPEVERFRVHLPLYNGVTELRVGLRPGSTCEVHPPVKKPLCVYGTSIIQGGCASRPGMAPTAILGRLLDCPVINLGFSGNGRAEPHMADILAEIKPAAFVVDCLPNIHTDFAEAHLSEFIPRLLRASGDVPVVFVGFLNAPGCSWTPAFAERVTSVERTQKEILARHKAEFPGRIYEIPGEALLGSDDEGTVDGIHPTDLGFHRMAVALSAALRPLLEK